jgi:peptidoglycan hydrolase CwlO-like protein
MELITIDAIVLLLTITTSLLAALFAVIGWIGSRVVNKQDEMINKLDDVKDELHRKINNLDGRLVRVETKVGLND